MPCAALQIGSWDNIDSDQEICDVTARARHINHLDFCFGHSQGNAITQTMIHLSINKLLRV